MPEIERAKPSEKSKIEAIEIKIAEIEKAIIAALKGLRAVEYHVDEPFVPSGEYLGEKFSD